MRDKIFISYRRGDTRGVSGRLYDWMCLAFGRGSVFRDVHSIGVGRWRDKIDAALRQSVVCVVVIGPRWADETNHARLRDSQDMVRHEVLTALSDDGVTVVPTLVEGAGLPSGETLPPELRPVVEAWNVRAVTEDRWESDIRELIREIAAETGLSILSPDLDSLLAHIELAKKRILAMERENQLQAGQVVALHRTIEDLTHRLAEATGRVRTGLVDAFAALARGDTTAAEEAFEREYESQLRQAGRARAEAADAALNVANLALLHDVRKAVRYYREALNFASDSARHHRLLGEALVKMGDLSAAQEAFGQAIDLASDQHDVIEQSLSLVSLGDLASSRGALDEAMARIESAIALRQPPDGCLPDGRDARFLVSAKMHAAHVTRLLGESAAALHAFRSCVEPISRLLAQNPSDENLQDLLALTHSNIGSILSARGYTTQALASHRAALSVREALAAAEPSAYWKMRTASAHMDVGSSLVALGEVEAAQASLQTAISLLQTLTTADPAHVQRHRLLAEAHLEVATLFSAQGNAELAVGNASAALDITAKLVALDSSNTDWQRDLAVAHRRLGKIQAQFGERDEATRALRAARDIVEALHARDPNNAVWHRDVLASQLALHQVTEDKDSARRALEVALVLRQRANWDSRYDWWVAELRRRLEE